MRSGRTSLRELEGPLDEVSSNYALCRTTGYSYNKILTIIAAQKKIDIRSTAKALRCSNRAIYSDEGRWSMLIQWISLYVNQWEVKFREIVMQDLVNLPDKEKILQTFAMALGIKPEALTYFSEHRDEIEAFLETQRSLLGTLAEVKLWELVQAGDPATIRWLLPRIKTKEYGDKDSSPQQGSKINIIEVDGAI